MAAHPVERSHNRDVVRRMAPVGNHWVCTPCVPRGPARLREPLSFSLTLDSSQRGAFAVGASMWWRVDPLGLAVVRQRAVSDQRRFLVRSCLPVHDQDSGPKGSRALLFGRSCGATSCAACTVRPASDSVAGFKHHADAKGAAPGSLVA